MDVRIYIFILMSLFTEHLHWPKNVIDLSPYIACKQRAHLPRCVSSMMKNALCYFGLIAFSFSSAFVLLICFISFNLFHTKHLEINHRNQNHKVRSWTNVIRYELRLR